jgi:hypothetical protein
MFHSLISETRITPHPTAFSPAYKEGNTYNAFKRNSKQQFECFYKFKLQNAGQIVDGCSAFVPVKFVPIFIAIVEAPLQKMMHVSKNFLASILQGLNFLD